MNNTYLFLVYSLCAITIIYLIHVVILTELNKYNKHSDNKTGDDNYDDNVEMLSYQLRGLYIEVKVEDIFNNIYEGVIQTALIGKTSLGFSIMCIQFKNHPVEGCNNYDGYKEWSLREKNKNINPNIIRNRVINKLQNAFPDSNITHSHHNCCDYYKITW